MPRKFSSPSIVLTTLALASTLLAGVVIARALASEATPAPALLPHVPGELLIKFRAEALEEDRLAVREQLAVAVLHTFHSGAQHWRLAAGISVEEALASLAENGDVEYAEPNAIATLYSPRVPLDLYYDPNQWAPQIIEAEDAWGVTVGDPNVIVAIVDIGVRRTHVDLDNNMWTNAAECDPNADPNVDDDIPTNGYIDDCYGYDFISDHGDPNSDQQHATSIAGIIGAEASSSAVTGGIAGLNWEVRLMNLKAGVINAQLAEGAEAIEYAADNGADIVNASWGYSCSNPSTCHTTLRDAIMYAATKEVLVVAAAGNDGIDIDGSSGEAPARYTFGNVIGVAASTIADEAYEHTNTGAVSVDLAAPGLDIWTTIPVAIDSEVGPYGNFFGTSSATPHVVGVAALIRAVKPSIPAESIKGLILQGVDVLPTSSGLGPGATVTGGRLNARKALPSVDTVSPTAISNLSATNSAGTTMSLSWTSSGDNYADGTATFYDIRYSTSVITVDNWETRSLDFNEPAPLVSGSSQSTTVSGLSSGTCYYWAMKGYDEWGNGPTSNMVKCGTRPAMCTTYYCKQVGEVWQRCTFNSSFGSCGCCSYTCVADETCENGEPPPSYACGSYCL